MTRANAPLTELGRLRLARCVVHDHWPLRPAADRFQVSVGTAQRWADRYRELGAAGMADRSSRPLSSPRRTQTRAERRIIKVRLARRWGPARIAYLLGLVPSTVHRILTRYRLARLSHLDRATAHPVRRYERATPSEPAHVDITKLGSIPDGGGHRVHGRQVSLRNSSGPTESPSHEYSPTTARATGPSSGGTPSQPPASPTNAPSPYRPQTNGKVECFNRTLLDEWAYARLYRSETERCEAFPRWLHTCNHHRGHTALEGLPPVSRVPDLMTSEQSVVDQGSLFPTRQQAGLLRDRQLDPQQTFTKFG